MENAGLQLAEAEAFMVRAEAAFRASDKEAILDLFDDDVSVIFADFPPMRGKEAYSKFLAARMRRQHAYRPVTTVMAVYGNVIGSRWEASWTDAHTGLEMKGHGCEFVTIENGRVVQFVASFNAWNEKAGPTTPIV